MADDWVLFTCSRDMSIVAPDDWTVEEDRHAFTLHAPDNQAVINVFRCEADSNGGDYELFEITMVAGIVKKRKNWKPVEKSEVKIRYRPVARRDLVADPEGETRWRLYTYAADGFYYAIIVEATVEAMALNGERYERIVRTFKGGEGQ